VDDIAAFITARLDEKAEGAWAVHDVAKCDALLYEEDLAGAAARIPDCDCGHPARVRRQVAALRAIVRRCEGCMNEPDQYPNGLVSPRALLARQTLIWLTSIWSDQPDYRQEWKP
jgi:hypothetical protein